jgi:hypothetical protein
VPFQNSGSISVFPQAVKPVPFTEIQVFGKILKDEQNRTARLLSWGNNE